MQGAKPGPLVNTKESEILKPCRISGKLVKFAFGSFRDQCASYLSLV